jgi:ankyrin repeat protein
MQATNQHSEYEKIEKISNIANSIENVVFPKSKSKKIKYLNITNHNEILNLLIINEDLDTIESFIKDGLNINLQDINGSTALMYVIENNTNIAKLLIENGADINIMDKFGKTALIYAIEKGNKEVEKLLIEKGAKISAREKSLIENRAKIETNINKKYNIKEQASYIKSIKDVLRCESEEKKYLNKEQYIDKLKIAIKTNDITLVKFLISKKNNINNINVQDSNGITALMYAIELNNLAIVILLMMKKEINIDIQDNNGRTAIMYAIKAVNIDLWKKELDKNIIKTFKVRAIEIIKLLITKGANLNLKISGSLIGPFQSVQDQLIMINPLFIEKELYELYKLII